MLRTFDQENKTLTLRLPNWSDFLEYLEDAPCTSPDTQRASRKSSMGPDWSGTRSWAENMQFARAGWSEGEKRITPLTANLFDLVGSMIEKEHIVYDVEGMSIDIARYLDDEPECWQKWEVRREEGPGTRHLKIVYNFGVSAGVDKSIINAKGAAIAALVQLLEYSGVRCEVIAGSCSKDSHLRGPNDYTLDILVTVKEYDQDLDMGRLAFALANVSMCRRCEFHIMETMPAEFRTALSALGTGGSYGYPAPMPASERGDMYIGESYYGEPHWENVESTRKWIMDTLRKQGVQLNEELSFEAK